MTSEAWFVLFPKARVPSDKDVQSVLAKIRNATVRRVEDLSFDVTVRGGAGFGVGLNDASYVVAETREIVARHRKTLANADEIATYDARFELIFSRDDIGDVFGQLLSAAERLAKLTSGVVYEANTSVFQ